jgi:hypothetical protein
MTPTEQNEMNVDLQEFIAGLDPRLQEPKNATLLNVASTCFCAGWVCGLRHRAVAQPTTDPSTVPSVR